MKTTMSAALTLEEQLPAMVPRAVIPPETKTATVKLKADYWPSVPVMGAVVDKPDRLLAGSRVTLPWDEARHIVGRGVAELVFE